MNAKRGIEITSDELLYDRQARTTRVQGNAVMVDRKNEVVIKGGVIEDWEAEGETLIQIGVRILKNDLVCRSEFARYRRDEDRWSCPACPTSAGRGTSTRRPRSTSIWKTTGSGWRGTSAGRSWRNRRKRRGEDGASP